MVFGNVSGKPEREVISYLDINCLDYLIYKYKRKLIKNAKKGDIKW